MECQVKCRIPTLEHGEFFMYLYRNKADPSEEHLAFCYGAFHSKSLNAIRNETNDERRVRGADSLIVDDSKSSQSQPEFAGTEDVLCRVHSSCFTGETGLSSRCDCGFQLHEAMRLIKQEKRGIVLYLRQEGRGIGLLDKLKAYNLQDMGYDTVQANQLLNHPIDGRSYDVAAQILNDLNVNSIRLLTNNPDKIQQLQDQGIQVNERIPIFPKKTSHEMEVYLMTKISKMSHMMEDSDSGDDRETLTDS